jgi:putative (di)nucleoside polyphosphate hydrolase
MLGSDLQHLDEIRKKGYRPEVVGCFIHDSKILLVYKKIHDLWQLPQGGIDNLESIDQAFWREFREELGEAFADSCDKNIKMIGANQIKFSVKNARELNSDEGRPLNMKGKKYFFIVAHAALVDFKPVEFDDYKWLNHEQATELAYTIDQIRKKKLTIKILDLLKKKGFIK